MNSNWFLSIMKVEICKFLPKLSIQNSSWILKVRSFWNLTRERLVIASANSICSIIAQNLNWSSQKMTSLKINQSTSRPRKRTVDCKIWKDFSWKETLKLKGWLRRVNQRATLSEILAKWIRCRSLWPTQCRICNELRWVRQHRTNTSLRAVVLNLPNNKCQVWTHLRKRSQLL